MSGKGSGRRPTDEYKYRSNWEAIFGKTFKEVEQQGSFKEQHDLPKETKDTGS